MELITNVTEYEKLAKEKLPKMVYDYYASGAEDQWTLKENREAFSRILFRPRILIDVSRIDMATNVLGFNISMPIMIAPTAMQKMAHPDGELATARAAASAGTIMTLSSWSTSSVEEVNSVGPGIRFFQLYVYKDRNIVRQLVKRAEMAGFKAIALTVDTPILGRREADIKNSFTLPPHLVLKNFEALDLGTMDKTNDSGFASYVAGQVDRTLSWKDIKWLQTITSLPILVKGVVTAEDTRLAIENGAAGIIVSNHGARQLDYVPATISCLEEVVREAKGRLPVFLDGGVRRGTDVFKALALGASGVFIGRPVLFALAVDGKAGVRNALRMLRDELEITMALSGCTSLKDITRDRVVLQPDRFLSELTSMYERSTEKGSVWVTMKRSTLKSKAQLQKMEKKGQEVEHRCLIRASDGKKSISTSVSLKEYAKFQASYATVLKAHMHALKKRERKDKKKAADSEKAIETAPKKQKKASSKKSSGSKS
ncbi:unnamed protein product [Miscanthus lutarioriparius]|uniref:Signal recognition particle 14 kDa protein n=1 Tax=Miscanthus lutarioriparius TaxID=422564 RepID=A0A811QRP5_9POAL|nr:unnamed protein product [Miscanthus lutarioriparius]